MSSARQVPPHIVGVLIPFLRIALERAHYDLDERRINTRDPLFERYGTSCQHLMGEGAELTGERAFPSDDLVEDRSCSEDVGSLIDRRTEQLLRRQITVVTQDHPGLRRQIRGPGICVARNREAEQLHDPLAVEHDVVRFDVTVDDAHLVRDGEPAAQVFDNRQT